MKTFPFLINQLWVDVEIKVIDGQPYKRALLTQKSNQKWMCVWCFIDWQATLWTGSVNLKV